MGDTRDRDTCNTYTTSLEHSTHKQTNKDKQTHTNIQTHTRTHIKYSRHLYYDILQLDSSHDIQQTHNSLLSLQSVHNGIDLSDIYLLYFNNLFELNISISAWFSW